MCGSEVLLLVLFHYLRLHVENLGGGGWDRATAIATTALPRISWCQPPNFFLARWRNGGEELAHLYYVYTYSCGTVPWALMLGYLVGGDGVGKATGSGVRFDSIRRGWGGEKAEGGRGKGEGGKEAGKGV